MANDETTFNGGRFEMAGQDVDFEILEWDATVTLLPLQTAPWNIQMAAHLLAGGTLVHLPKGHPELN